MAADQTAGVIGAVVPVNSNPTVETAYSNWNVDPCTVASGNEVVSAIAQMVDTIRKTHKTIANVVIVGADDQNPFARIADGATESNERTARPPPSLGNRTCWLTRSGRATT